MCSIIIKNNDRSTLKNHIYRHIRTLSLNKNSFGFITLLTFIYISTWFPFSHFFFFQKMIFKFSSKFITCNYCRIRTWKPTEIQYRCSYANNPNMLAFSEKMKCKFVMVHAAEWAGMMLVLFERRQPHSISQMEWSKHASVTNNIINNKKNVLSESKINFASNESKSICSCNFKPFE